MRKKIARRLSGAGLALLLGLTAAFPAYAANLSGHLDAVGQNEITGWAWNQDAPADPVSVELTLAGGNGPNGTVTVSVTANQSRADLKKALGSSAHAFTYEIDWSAYEGDTFTVTATAVSGDERRALEGSFTYTKSAASSQAPAPKASKDKETGAGKTQEEKASAPLTEKAKQIGPGFASGEADAATENTDAKTENTDTKTDETDGKLKAGETSGPSINDGGSSAPETGRQGNYLGEYVASGYCNCSKCSGGFNRTSSGTIPKAKHTIAADTDVFPIGTKLMIGGIVYTVEDTGSGIQNNRLDIFFDSHQEAVNYGLQKVKVYAVE